MELTVTPLENGITAIQLVGRMDMKNTLLIDSQITALVARENARVVIEMSGVDFVASVGLRLLISCAKTNARQGGHLALWGLQPMVAESFGIAGIDVLIAIHETLQDALVGMPSLDG